MEGIPTMPTPGLESRARRRTLFTNETYQQARAALLGPSTSAAPIPRPTTHQERLEADVWREICWPSEIFAHPLGITCVRPGATLDVEVESAAAATILLRSLLPAKLVGEDDGAAEGVAGLRVQVTDRALALSRPGGAVVRLTGLERGTFEAVLEQYHRYLNDNGLEAVVAEAGRQVPARPSHGPQEHPAAESAGPGARAAMDALASALLRRSALFHTTTTSYYVTVWQAGGLEEWHCELFYAPGSDAGDLLVEALRDPLFGVGSSGRSERDERFYDKDGRERARRVSFEPAATPGAGLQLRLRHSPASEAVGPYRQYARGPMAVAEDRLRALFPTLAGHDSGRSAVERSKER